MGAALATCPFLANHNGWEFNALIGVARSHDLLGVGDGVRTTWIFRWKARALRKKEGGLDAERVTHRCHFLPPGALRKASHLKELLHVKISLVQMPHCGKGVFPFGCLPFTFMLIFKTLKSFYF